jgi:hypothetical protein
MGSKVNGINQIGTAECHPEKAGVGGSIPSLATKLARSLEQKDQSLEELRKSSVRLDNGQLLKKPTCGPNLRPGGGF